MNNLSNLIIVEGETEKKFLADFKDNLKIPAKIIVFNLAQKELKSNIIGKKYNVVSVILDADLFNNSNLDRINKNLRKLNAKRINVYIQNQKFEDELIRCLENCKSLNDLCNIFGCKTSNNDFKTRFMKTGNLCNKRNFNINFHSLYQTSNKYKKIITNGNIKTGKSLFKKNQF